MAATASDRVELRLSPELKQELETASSLLGITTSAFVKDAAVRAAHHVIEQQRQIRLGDEAWEKFQTAIERPGRPVEGLAELLARPTAFRDE